MCDAKKVAEGVQRTTDSHRDWTSQQRDSSGRRGFDSRKRATFWNTLFLFHDFAYRANLWHHHSASSISIKYGIFGYTTIFIGRH